ncbi:MAG: hypothetical protein ACPGRX_02845 [Bdellovibrionales bacterium]
MTVTIDTLQAVKALQKVKFTEAQAEAITALFTSDHGHASKADLMLAVQQLQSGTDKLQQEMQSDISRLRQETQSDISQLRHEMQSEFKLVRQEMKAMEDRILLKITGIFVAVIGLLKAFEYFIAG